MATLYITFTQKQPILTMEPGEGVIYSTKWSPSRPSLFAATTATGLLLLYDLTQSQPVPMYKLEAGTQTGNTRAPVLTCQFNPHQWVQLYILSLLIYILITALFLCYRPKWVFYWYFVVLIFWMDLSNNSYQKISAVLINIASSYALETYTVLWIAFSLAHS